MFSLVWRTFERLASMGSLGGWGWGMELFGDVAAGPGSGSGLLLENGTDYLLLETGDFLLLEA